MVGNAAHPMLVPMIEPTFGPGTGWHKPPPMAMLGSPAWMDGRQAAAYECTVFLMRQLGVRTPAPEAIARCFTGLLVAEPFGDGWSAVLYSPAWAEQLQLFDARLMRDQRGCRLYRGLERDADGKGSPQWLQSWFCAPTPERGRKVLSDLAAAQSWRTVE